MIGKVCRRGTDTRRLLGYLFTEGLAGERGLDSAHVDARVIAGYQPPGGLEPQRRADGRADVTRLAALLDAPVRAGGVGKAGRATYHLAISAAPPDRLLSDAEWADIAESYLDRLGLAERGDDSAVRWVAVRHADNHVHVVATLVRQDGRRVFPHHDFYRAREASLEVERRYGLTPTSPVDRTANPETTRAEQRKHKGAVRAAAQAGMPPPAGPDREVLRARVRAALAGSDGWEQFADRLRLSGVLVRERYSTRNPGELTGYAVSLPTRGPDRGGAAGVVRRRQARPGPVPAPVARPLGPGHRGQPGSRAMGQPPGRLLERPGRRAVRAGAAPAVGGGAAGRPARRRGPAAGQQPPGRPGSAGVGAGRRGIGRGGVRRAELACRTQTRRAAA